MITSEEIKKLASLSRMSIDEEEVQIFSKEIGSILEYVGTIQSIQAPPSVDTEGRVNVMRDDLNPHESGLYTNEILKEAPTVEDGFIVVKKILGTSE
jgi:aspartyl-tRNA(Asn)/glutamyl-tRNA(Gln) amidotransferase subunit C